jgi:tripartite-type tricarboxylate transporter receptor subunit TctC
MLMPSAAFLARPLQMGIDIGLDDVTVIGSVARSVSFISVQKESPVLGLPEVVETAKNDPLAIDYATTGLGGIPHMAMSLLEKATGGKFTIVTFGGSPQAILAAVGGQTDLAVTDVTNEGLRPIAAISEKRSSFYPDVPTLSDLGYGIGMSSIFFVIAPKGIPEDVASELEKQLLAAIEKPSVQDTLKKLQLDSAVQAGADTVKELERQSDMYRSVLSDLGLLGAESGK